MVPLLQLSKTKNASIEPVYKSLYSMYFEYYTNENNDVENYINENCIEYNDTMNYIEIIFKVNEIISYKTMLNKLSQIKLIVIDINNKFGDIISSVDLNNLKLSDYSFKQDWEDSNEICYLYTKFDKTTNIIKS